MNAPMVFALFAGILVVDAIDINTGNRVENIAQPAQPASLAVTDQGDMKSDLSGIMRSEGGSQRQSVALDAAAEEEHEWTPTFSRSAYGNGKSRSVTPANTVSMKVHTSGYAQAHGMNEFKNVVGWSAGAQCDIPMWNLKDYACKEARTVLPMNAYTDQHGIDHRLLNHGQACTTTCSTQKWWEGPNITKMTCLNGVFVTADNMPISALTCLTAVWIWVTIAVGACLCCTCSGVSSYYLFSHLRRRGKNGPDADYYSVPEYQPYDAYGNPYAPAVPVPGEPYQTQGEQS